MTKPTKRLPIVLKAAIESGVVKYHELVDIADQKAPRPPFGGLRLSWHRTQALRETLAGLGYRVRPGGASIGRIEPIEEVA